MSFNLLKYAAFTNVYGSTQVDSTGAVAASGSTGQALGLSTAGSSGTGAQSSAAGGYPFATAGWDMAGFDGALVIANITSWTTGPAGGNHTLQIYGGNTVAAATALSTTFTILPDAYAFGNSSTPFALVVDVVKPRHRFLQAQVQVASSSGIVTSVNVLRYAAKKEPTTQQSVATVAPTGAAGAVGFLAGSYVSVSPST